MDKKFHFSLNLFHDKGKFLVLLISILFLFTLKPFLESFIRIRFLMDIFISVILFSSIYAVSKRRSVFISALLISLPMFVSLWSGYSGKIPSSLAVGRIFGALFFAFTAIVILLHVFKERKITADVIIGAICVYFLIGLMWAFIFSVLEIFQPGSFHIEQSLGVRLSDFSYYSFVTLTTLGYGDITPLSPPARSLCLLEAITGQLYLAVMIAGLVGIYVSQSRQ
jgi:hypothetical protein